MPLRGGGRELGHNLVRKSLQKAPNHKHCRLNLTISPENMRLLCRAGGRRSTFAEISVEMVRGPFFLFDKRKALWKFCVAMQGVTNCGIPISDRGFWGSQRPANREAELCFKV